MPANPIFGGWSSYARQRGVPLNNNPNLSEAEYAARLASLGNPAGAQSYADYMASDDYAAGWRPGSTTPVQTRPRPSFGDVFQWLLGGAQGPWPRPNPAPTPTPTPTPTGNYAVPTQLGGVPNIIPVGANITDGTTTTTNNPTPATPTTPAYGGGQPMYWSPTGNQPTPWQGTSNPNNMSYPPGSAGPAGNYRDRFNQSQGGQGMSASQIIAGQQPPQVVQEWSNKRRGKR